MTQFYTIGLGVHKDTIAIANAAGKALPPDRRDRSEMIWRGETPVASFKGSTPSR